MAEVYQCSMVSGSRASLSHAAHVYGAAAAVVIPLLILDLRWQQRVSLSVALQPRTRMQARTTRLVNRLGGKHTCEHREAEVEEEKRGCRLLVATESGRATL